MFDSEFYKKLKKPSFTPPAVVFKIVWPILYLTIFISGFIIAVKESSLIKKVSLIIFAVQLLINIIWSPVFFVFRKIKLAFILAVSMTVLAAITIFLFSQISLLAGNLLIPYLLWLIFACYLNFYILKMNK